MEILMSSVPRCWCGNDALSAFGGGYHRCDRCETLVASRWPAPETLTVTADEEGLYGRDYWFSHQQEKLGHADIYARARTDVPERGLYWLRALSALPPPPGHTLEIGSAHGGLCSCRAGPGMTRKAWN
jgi:hypothetical protein